MERENASDVSNILNQKTSQLESIQRLITSAEDRLSRENEQVEQIKQEIEFSENPEEKQNAEAKLRSSNNRIEELINEIQI